MKKLSILITGANGYIGSNLKKYLSDSYDIIAINRQDFDLRDEFSSSKWFNNKYFDVVIHTAIKGGSRLEVDDSSILDDNIRMYLNLLSHKDRYGKFINIGSGAEISSPQSYYGMSKNVINNSIQDKDNFYSLRIYGIFDENEIERRFIKNNIVRYLNKKDLLIYQNKYMDFIYFPDFIKIIQTYLEKPNLPKTFDCVYQNKYSLIHIANIINTLDNYCVNIQVKNTNNDIDYMGIYHDIHLNYIGLENGILETYKQLRDKIKHD